MRKWLCGAIVALISASNPPAAQSDHDWGDSTFVLTFGGESRGFEPADLLSIHLLTENRFSEFNVLIIAQLFAENMAWLNAQPRTGNLSVVLCGEVISTLTVSAAVDDTSVMLVELSGEHDREQAMTADANNLLLMLNGTIPCPA